MTRIVTHSGGFHADDAFAVATLLLLHPDAEVVRTRDPKVFETGDFVVDVGGEYDPARNRFDHHQEGGAGERDDSVPYATFGLVWKHYGANVCDRDDVNDPEAVAGVIEKKLVTPVDAFDNGVDITSEKIPDVHPYRVEQIFFSLEPTWQEPEKTTDEAFGEAVTLAGRILEREIVHAQAAVEAEIIIKDMYEKADNKQLVIFDDEYRFDRSLIAKAFTNYEDVLYFVRKHEGGLWQVVAAVDDIHSFDKRKPLPEEWAGKRDEELQKATGVETAVFCHNKRFMCIARTQEGAMTLAKLALEK